MRHAEERKKGTLTNIAIQAMSTAIFPLVVLQALSYRLIGVEARCQWGYAQAQPVSRPTKNQVRFATTFPHVLIVLVSVVLIALVQVRLL
jgi:hypothetical protein